MYFPDGEDDVQSVVNTQNLQLEVSGIPTFYSFNMSGLAELSEQDVFFNCHKAGPTKVRVVAEWSDGPDTDVLASREAFFNVTCIAENCEDEVDNDDDGFVDCEDMECLVAGECDLSTEPSVTDWSTDLLGDLFYSISELWATLTGDQIDINGSGIRIDDLGSAEVVEHLFGNTVVECGTTTDVGTVVCPTGVDDMPEGDLLTVSMRLEEDVPLADTGHSYIYSAVFDSDGVAANDWVIHEPYDWDLFQGADRWYQLIWDHAARSWSVSVTQVSASQTTSEVSSAVRALISDNVVTFYIPMSELSDDAAYRVCAFGHDGRYSQDDSGAHVNGVDPTEPLTPVR